MLIDIAAHSDMASRLQPQEQVTSQRVPPALISWTSSVTAAATSNEWQATPLALLGSFRVSLRPCPADRLLLGRRVAAWYDSGQVQGDYRLAHDALKAG